MINIKVLSKELNISSRTLRYYEELGLINSTKINNQRCYSDQEIRRINMILLLRKIDLSLLDIKKLFNNYSTESFNNIIKNKINAYYKNISINSKKLEMLKRIEEKVNNDDKIEDIILNETTKVLNQDGMRVNIVKEFLLKAEKEEFESLIDILDSHIDMNIIKKVFIDDMKLNEKNYQYNIYNHLSYYNNMIFLKLVKDKTYLIRFVFNEDNVIVGIWLDKSY